MDMDHLKAIRIYELLKVVPYIVSRRIHPITLLEIGAGVGWQAKALSELGLVVEAIDIEHSNYAESQVFDVKRYDGAYLPYPDSYFDVVFSSNVLEHIKHFHEFQHEIKRVLKPDGIAVHVVPTGCWRFWSNVTHYHSSFKTFCVMSFQFAARHLRRSPPVYQQVRASRHSPVSVRENNWRACWSFFLQLLFPSRHGEIGNAVTEMYYFSGWCWRRRFSKSIWKVETHSSNELFYTGYSMLGRWLPIRARKYLSHFIGSSCHVFILSR